MHWKKTLQITTFQCALPLLLIAIHSTKVNKIKWKTFMRLIVKIVGHTQREREIWHIDPFGII